MSTITTINTTDLITNSRTVINTNFSNLNTDKIETSYLDTDTTLAANSDTKIPSQKAIKTYVDSSGLTAIPVGSLLSFGGSVLPDNYLFANGAAVSRSTYAALFSAIGTTFGTGNGSTTFNLPSKTTSFTGTGVARDANSAGVTTGEQTTLTVSHVIGATATLLLVYVAISKNPTTDTVTGVTYNGVAMTRLKAVAYNSTLGYQYIYGLLSPTVGTHNIVITSSASTTINCRNSSYVGVSVSQTLPDSSQLATSASATSLTEDITIIGNSAWVFAGGYAGGGSVVAGTNLNLITTGASTVHGCLDSNGYLGSGSRTIGITATSGEMGLISVSFLGNVGIDIIKY